MTSPSVPASARAMASCDASRRHPSALFDDQPARHEAVDGVDHHEGIAARRMVDRRAPVPTGSRDRSARRCIAPRARGSGCRAGASPSVARARRRPRSRCCARSPAVHSPSQHVADDEQLRGDLALGQPRERVDRVDVRPLEILEDEDEGQVVATGRRARRPARRTSGRRAPPARRRRPTAGSAPATTARAAARMRGTRPGCRRSSAMSASRNG